MIDLSVVVLPAPLRPSSVTTSPAPTSTPTPCRRWDSPYQACSPSTTRSGAAPGARTASFMADPHVGFAHVGVGGDGCVVALGQDAAAGEHGDAVGQVGDHAEIVLDHQHGAVGRYRLDESRDEIDVLMPHHGGRIVTQPHHG